MKVVVCVKQVAQLDDDFELRDDGRDVDPDCVEWDLNEWDAFALEAAVRLGESAAEAEIVVVTVGDDEAEERLRACLAKGADRAVRVWDGGLVDADVMLVARLLAAVVEREAPDLVLCGVQSSDGVSGATGVAMAGFLGLPRVAVVTGIDYDASARTATVERELEGGLVERLRVRTPALLTVQTGINEPRYASRRAIKQAREKPLEELTPADLGLDAEAVARTVASRVTAMDHPPKGDAAELIEGGPDEVAARILAIVEERVG